jgi:hypothetical protein
MLQYQEMDSGVRIQTNIFAGSKKEAADPEAKVPEASSPPGRAMDEQKMADMQRMLSTLMETAKLTIPEVPQTEEPAQVQTETLNPGEEIK